MVKSIRVTFDSTEFLGRRYSNISWNKAIISAPLVSTPVISKRYFANFCYRVALSTVLGTLWTMVLPNFPPNLHTALFKDWMASIYLIEVLAMLDFQASQSKTCLCFVTACYQKEKIVLIWFLVWQIVI